MLQRSSRFSELILVFLEMFALSSCSQTLLQVVISQMNGQDYASRSHVFTVGKTRIKLSRGWITKARELYSTSMQVS